MFKFKDDVTQARVYSHVVFHLWIRPSKGAVVLYQPPSPVCSLKNLRIYGAECTVISMGLLEHVQMSSLLARSISSRWAWLKGASLFWQQTQQRPFILNYNVDSNKIWWVIPEWWGLVSLCLTSGSDTVKQGTMNHQIRLCLEKSFCHTLPIWMLWN